MFEIVEEHIRREAAALEERRQGVIMLTVGKGFRAGLVVAGRV
jgi:hypothetical protein